MNKAWLGLLGAMLAAWGTADVATAQQWRDMSGAQSRATAAKFAHCTVVENRKVVREYLAKPVGADAEARIPAYLLAGCLMTSTGRFGGAQEMRMPKLLLRGLLFNALIARDLKRPATERFSAVAPLDYPVTGSDSAMDDLRRNYRALMRIGECTVRAAPLKVGSLLATPAGAAQEDAAVATLQGEWTACLPGRRDLRFTTDMMRAALAEPYYRIGIAAK